jgi:hypothetical protein
VDTITYRNHNWFLLVLAPPTSNAIVTSQNRGPWTISLSFKKLRGTSSDFFYNTERNILLYQIERTCPKNIKHEIYFRVRVDNLGYPATLYYASSLLLFPGVKKIDCLNFFPLQKKLIPLSDILK